MKFFGRKKELELLKTFLRKRSASFLVIRGRRRIGKTRLIEEFSSSMKYAIFSGLPPDSAVTRQSQLDAFAGQMSKLFGVPRFQFSDWGDAFWQLGQLTEHGRVVVAFDEISWMGSKDPMFLGQLKDAWDRHFSKNPKLIFIVCGSVSSWIAKNILSSTGFLGRVSYDLQLRELPLSEATAFWKSGRSGVAPLEMFKVLSVTGSVPRYLEEMLPDLSAEDNIRRLCFSEGGLLVREFDQILSDLFSKRAPFYAEIAKILSSGSCTLDAVSEQLKLEKTGAVSSYLKDLLHAGFVAEDCTWSLKTEKISQLKKYRLADNYLRFYLRYVEPNRAKILKSSYDAPLLTLLPSWNSVVGLQFENLVLNNIDAVLRALHVRREDLSMYGPFFQRPTQRQKGCQIDLMIQTRNRALYLCEIKFRMKDIGLPVVRELAEKRRRLSIPRGLSVHTVLIHVNGVTSEVMQSEELDHIVDFADLLTA